MTWVASIGPLDVMRAWENVRCFESTIITSDNRETGDKATGVAGPDTSSVVLCLRKTRRVCTKYLVAVEMCNVPLKRSGYRLHDNA